MAINNVAELKAATEPTHERGEVAESLANRYIDEIEEALWYGGGARFGQTGCPQVLIEDMVFETELPALAQTGAELLEYVIPGDVLKSRVIRLDGVVMKYDTNWAEGANRANVYKIRNSKFIVPVNHLYDAGTAKPLTLEYYRRFDSLRVAPNIISTRHSNVYINGFISLVLTETDRPDKAAEYWEQFTTAAHHLNDTRKQSAYIGMEVKRMGFGRRGQPA